MGLVFLFVCFFQKKFLRDTKQTGAIILEQKFFDFFPLNIWMVSIISEGNTNSLLTQKDFSNFRKYIITKSVVLLPRLLSKIHEVA